MNKNGEILIVDDDGDDVEIVCDTLKHLAIPNKVTCFTNAHELLTHLREMESEPFFILCDFRMPLMNGLELKQMIQQDETLRKKIVPFLLYSTTIDTATFNAALAAGVQGFFLKPITIQALRDLLQTIIKYMNDVMGVSDSGSMAKTD